jgi:hypothetical protein
MSRYFPHGCESSLNSQNLGSLCLPPSFPPFPHPSLPFPLRSALILLLRSKHVETKFNATMYPTSSASPSRVPTVASPARSVAAPHREKRAARSPTSSSSSFFSSSFFSPSDCGSTRASTKKAARYQQVHMHIRMHPHLEIPQCHFIIHHPSEACTLFPQVDSLPTASHTPRCGRRSNSRSVTRRGARSARRRTRRWTAPPATRRCVLTATKRPTPPGYSERTQ